MGAIDANDCLSTPVWASADVGIVSAFKLQVSVSVRVAPADVQFFWYVRAYSLNAS